MRPGGGGGQAAAGGQDDLQRDISGESTGRHPAGGLANQIIPIAAGYLKAGMIQVRHKGDGRHGGGVSISNGAGEAGDDVAESVGAPGYADFGKDAAYRRGHAVLVEGDGRLRAQPGQEIQGAAVGIG